MKKDFIIKNGTKLNGTICKKDVLERINFFIKNAKEEKEFYEINKTKMYKEKNTFCKKGGHGQKILEVIKKGKSILFRLYKDDIKIIESFHEHKYKYNLFDCFLDEKQSKCLISNHINKMPFYKKVMLESNLNNFRFEKNNIFSSKENTICFFNILKNITTSDFICNKKINIKSIIKYSQYEINKNDISNITFDKLKSIDPIDNINEKYKKIQKKIRSCSDLRDLLIHNSKFNYDKESKK